VPSVPDVCSQTLEDATTLVPPPRGARFRCLRPRESGRVDATMALMVMAKERLRLAVFWVSREGDELIVKVDS
jgi:hypothetical protein